MPTEDQVIALESYAAVVAGLGAGLPLTRSLECANIGVLDWNVGEEHWRERIEESAASDLSLLVAFDAALISAKRRFEPTVEPIESDVKAWAHFRRHFVTAVDAVGFLEKRGMSLSTYARLEGDWANRVLSDESLAAKLQEHMAEPLEDCPSITLAPSPLLVPRNAPTERKNSAPSPAPERVMPVIAQESSFLQEAMAHAAVKPPLVDNAPEVTPASIIDDPAGTTQFVTFHSFVTPALPFNPNAKPTEPQPETESRSVAELDPGQTMDWSLVASVVGKRATPFESNIAPAPVSATEDQLGSTMMFDSSQLLAAATPFEKPAHPPQQAAPQGSLAPSAFTLERYASICVEFAMAPTQMREIAARYGVNPEQWASMDAYWRGRMADEPDVRATWEKACITYRQWILQR